MNYKFVISDKYNLNNSLFMSYLSDLSYYNNEIIRNILSSCNEFSDYLFLDNNETQAFCIANHIEKYIIITFRGSNSMYDILKSIDSLYKIRSYIFIHEGFCDMLYHIFDDIKKYISNHNDYDIYLNGHSLGGSLAILCYIELFYEYKINVRDVYTFGSPKCVKFKNKVINKDNIYNHIINNDIISLLPFGNNYQYIGKNIYIYKSGFKIYNTNKNVNIFIIMKRILFNIFTLFKNHKSETYFTKIYNIIKRKL